MSHDSQVGADIRQSHVKEGLSHKRMSRKNHISTTELLAVPRYADLLDDDDSDTVSGDQPLPLEAMPSSKVIKHRSQWRVEMRKWIEEQWDSDEEEVGPEVSASTGQRVRRWLPKTLSDLFDGEPKRPLQRRARNQHAFDEEALLMELLAQEEEDPIADAGELEGSGDEYEAK
jgi:hypothetical protein